MPKSKKKLTIGGLCSGVGGIELGFRQAGFDISWANDMDKNAMITYESIIGQNHYIGCKAIELENIISNKKLSKIGRVLELFRTPPMDCSCFNKT